MIEAFPLQWPAGYEVTERRSESNFKCTLAEARDGILSEIRLLAGNAAKNNAIISTNMNPGKNGQITSRSVMVYPNPGAAVYFEYDGEEKVIACDKWKYLHENLRAIQRTIEAIRALGRHGATGIVPRALSNMKALPQTAGKSNGSWWDILCIPGDCVTETDVKEAYKLLAMRYHPDNKLTGDKDKFITIQEAYEAGLKALSKNK